MGKTLCFTGRRPKDLYGYEKSAYNDLYEFTKNTIRTYAENGYDTFISGGAQGFDQLCFWAVNSLKKEFSNIKNVVYAPCTEQASKWKADSLFGQKEYNTMLKLADEVVYVHERPYKSAGDMLDRNHAMANHSDAILCLYPNFDWTFSKGGTAECMRYAKDMNIEMKQISYNENDKNAFHLDTVNDPHLTKNEWEMERE